MKRTNAQKIPRLVALRRSKRMTQEHAAEYFGLREGGRDRFRAWEYIEPQNPCPVLHRPQFIKYLRFLLDDDSEQLREIYQQIQSAWGWAPLTDADCGVMNRPQQLPTATPQFFGHAKELALLIKRFSRPRSPHPILGTIYGMGGSGKTELAIAVGYAVAASFPDGIIFVDLHASQRSMLSRGRDSAGKDPATTNTISQPADGLIQVIRALRGVDIDLPPTYDEILGLYRETLRGKYVLIIVDDVPTIQALRCFVPPVGCGLLATSHQRMRLDGTTTVVDLKPLPYPEAQALFLTRAPQLANDPALANLLDICGGLPLALHVAGGALTDHIGTTSPSITLPYYLAQIQDEQKRFSKFAHQDQNVYAIIGVSDRLLQDDHPALSRLWRMLHICPTGFIAAVASAIWDESDEDEVRDLLSRLVSHSLITYDEANDQYRLHGLLRAVGQARCDSENTIVARRRHATFFGDKLRTWSTLYQRNYTGVLQALAAFDANKEHILAAHAWCAQHVSTADDVKLYLAYTLTALPVTTLRIPATERIEWLKRATEASRNVNDKNSESFALQNIGNAYREVGNAQAALDYYSEALAIAIHLNDEQRVGRLRTNQALSLIRLGYYHKALEKLTYYLGYLQSNHIRDMDLGYVLGNFGLAYSGLGIKAESAGKYDQARAHYLQSLAYNEQHSILCRELGDKVNEAYSLMNIGSGHTQLKNAAVGLEYLRQALPIIEQIQDQRTEGKIYSLMGIAYAGMCQYEQARTAFLQSIALATQVEDSAAVANVHWNLGQMYADLEDYEAAVPAMQIYVDFERDIDHPEYAQDAQTLQHIRDKRYVQRYQRASEQIYQELSRSFPFVTWYPITCDEFKGYSTVNTQSHEMVIKYTLQGGQEYSYFFQTDILNLDIVNDGLMAQFVKDIIDYFADRLNSVN